MRLLQHRVCPRLGVAGDRHKRILRLLTQEIAESVESVQLQHGPVVAVISVHSLNTSPVLEYRTRGLLSAEAEGVPGPFPEDVARFAVDAMDSSEPCELVVVVHDEWMVRNRETRVFSLDLLRGSVRELEPEGRVLSEAQPGAIACVR